ncbi:MAG TPA: MarR family transcriptional regulator [bacterium]|jgi:DNA-binding MarR family transcriptional regulator|nr:MarR family transcriptional regulator [bacterium]
MNIKSEGKRDQTEESRAIIDALRRLVRGLRLYARHCEARLGLSAAQLFALRKVQEAGALNLRGLARATLTDLSSVSVVAERLRAKGLLHSRRSPDDRRKVELTLAARGAALLKRSPDPLQDRLVASLRGMSPARRRALERDLGVLVRDAGLDGQAARLFFEDEA